MSESDQVVCVIGASGFLACNIIKLLLQQTKFQVRGTVRSLQPEKVETLKQLGEQSGSPKRLELFEADLLKAGSFDKATAGCDFVLHTASPFILENTLPAGFDPEEVFYKPAIQGTLNVLESAKKNGVKKVVLTSSFVSVAGTQQKRNPAHVFNESDWNDAALQRSAPTAYETSKTLAELAAWEFVSKTSIKLVTILPSFILGPPVASRVDPVSIGAMAAILQGKVPGIPNTVFANVDVRNVAEAHIKALQIEEAVGKRFILSNTTSMSFEEIAKVGKSQFPFLTPPEQVSLQEGETKQNGQTNFLDNSQAKNILGITFTDFETTLRDMVNRLVELSIITKP